MTRKTALGLAVLLLAGTLLVFEFTSLDIAVQDSFFSTERQAWLVPKAAALPRAFFYRWPKYVLIGFGAWLLISMAFRGRHKSLSRHSRLELVYLLVCLGGFPAFIGAMKSVSGLHCPSELTRYGGHHAYRKIFSARPADRAELGHCFPAGHASGGFALLGLWFVARSRAEKTRALLLGLGAGSAMGLYQMLNGSHFLSHTIVTMLLGWIFALSAAMLLHVGDSSRTVA